MAETVTKLPVKSAARKAATVPTPAPAWHPFDDLRREIDRLFQDFDGGWLRPFRPRPSALEPMFGGQFDWSTPAVDVAEKDKAFEITAELPGIDPKNIEVSLRNGNIVIRGEKQEEKEEKDKDYYLRERQFGSFERSFVLPDGIDRDKIEASFNKGVLTVSLPKTAAARKPEKKISVKAA